jgi:hypothetical protein
MAQNNSFRDWVFERYDYDIIEDSNNDRLLDQKKNQM